MKKTRKTKAMTPMTIATTTPELSPGEWYSTFGSAASVSDDVGAADVQAMLDEGTVVDGTAGLGSLGELPGLAVCNGCEAMAESPPPVVAGTLEAGDETAVPAAAERASGGAVVPPTRTSPSSVPPTTDTRVPASGSPPALTHGQVKPGIGAPE